MFPGSRERREWQKIACFHMQALSLDIKYLLNEEILSFFYLQSSWLKIAQQTREYERQLEKVYVHRRSPHWRI
jgi:hypothetical protein